MRGFVVQSPGSFIKQFHRAKNHTVLAYEDGQAFENLTVQDVASEFFEAGVANTLFFLHRMEVLTWEQVVECYERTPFKPNETAEKAYADWVEGTPMRRLS